MQINVTTGATSRRVVVLFLAIGGLLSVNAQTKGSYSGWFKTSDPDVQYQWRSLSYGMGLSPDCDMQFQYVGNADRISASFTMRYVSSGNSAGSKEGKAFNYLDKGVPGGHYVATNCNYITAVEVNNSKAIGSSGKRQFARPAITDIQFDAGSIAELKRESEALKLAGYAKTLTAWSPLITLAGESNAIHASVSISQTNWDEIARSFSTMDRLAFASLAMGARNQTLRPEVSADPKLKQFWNAMADFYYSQAQP